MRGPLLIATAAVALVSHAAAQEPARRYQVVTPKDDGIIATGLNARGELVGFEWAESKQHPGVVEQLPIYARGKSITYLPLLKGYTATFPAAVSDDGVVVGRSSKPAPPGVNVYLRNQAFLWDAATGIHGLGTLKDDMASFATGITRDGRRVSGFSVGENRVRPCFWERSAGAWKSTALPLETRLGSNVVAISDNGKYMAAVDGVLPCLWSEDAGGAWTREVIGDASALVPRAVNNSGTVVGLRYVNDGGTRAVIWTRDKGIEEPNLPEGYVKAEAGSINNAGVVVGMIDGPNGSKVGPNAFAFERGRMRVLDEGGPFFTAATAINDHDQVAGVFEKEEYEAPAAKKPDTP